MTDNVPFIEYEKGVIHADRRLDLCKMVLGPPNIENLLDSLDKNTFIKHVLLGNNIIGPKGARRVAKFIHDHPDQMETWYLAGNCINSEGFYDIVNGLLKSIASNLWLKRNPLTIDAVKDIARLISQSQNLQTLDLDQTGLTDAGVARLFDLLIASGEQQHVLKHLYLNGNGIGVQGATSIAGYLSSPSCSLKSLYLSNNPLGDAGVSILGRNIMLDSPMERLMISSVGMTSLGASKLLNSLAGHKNLLALDIGQSFATDDLGTRYNWITDDAFPSIRGYIRSTTSIRYLDFGVTAISFACINDILPIIADHNGLCWVGLDTIEFGRKKRDILLAGKLRQSISASLARNVLILYNGIEYKEFELGHKRSLTGPEEYVRKIDSVYRNRDAMLARRGLKPLDKWWDEKDPTIQTVMEWR